MKFLPDVLLELLSESGDKTVLGAAVQSIQPPFGVDIVTTATLAIDATTDNGKTKAIAHADGNTTTFPKTAPVGFLATLVQDGPGPVQVRFETGATTIPAAGPIKTRARGGAISVVVLTNTDGNSAKYAVSGDAVAS